MVIVAAGVSAEYLDCAATSESCPSLLIFDTQEPYNAIEDCFLHVGSSGSLYVQSRKAYQRPAIQGRIQLHSSAPARVNKAYDETSSSQIFSPVRKRTRMADLGAIVAQLKAERAKLDKAIEALSGVAGNSGGHGGRRKLSAAARARIAAAQRARWAKFKAKKAR